MACTRTLVFQCQVCVFSVMTKAFHKLLEIFKKFHVISQKVKTFLGLMLKYANCTTTEVRFLSIFVQFSA